MLAFSEEPFTAVPFSLVFPHDSCGQSLCLEDSSFAITMDPNITVKHHYYAFVLIGYIYLRMKSPCTSQVKTLVISILS